MKNGGQMILPVVPLVTLELALEIGDNNFVAIPWEEGGWKQYNDKEKKETYMETF